MHRAFPLNEDHIPVSGPVVRSRCLHGRGQGALRSTRGQAPDPCHDLLKVIAYRAMNLVIAGAFAQQAMFLPRASGYTGKLLQRDFGDKTSLKLKRRLSIASHYDARISWRSYSDQSELVRVGPSQESELVRVGTSPSFCSRGYDDGGDFCTLPLTKFAVHGLAIGTPKLEQLRAAHVIFLRPIFD